MDIQHNSLSRIIRTFTLIIIGLHLNPLCLQFAPRSTPLPPGLPSNLLDAMVTQLFLYRFGRFLDILLRNLDLVYLHPGRMRYPLRSETLYIFDGMVGGIEEEASDQIQAFVVGDMGCRFLRARFAIEVLSR